MVEIMSGPRTVVLIGRTGNGKSATGNSILGRKAFRSHMSSSGVTSSCELQQAVRQGRNIDVIDTPGLFDLSVETEYICKEIVRCLEMAKDGIHAFLLVFSVLDRFSEEETAAFHILKNMFGSKIVNYMVVVFTGGDQLEEDEMTLDDYLGANCPQSLKEILRLCGNRRVLFDNKSRDRYKKSEQVEKLLSLIDKVIVENGGQPYTNEYFLELKKGATKLHDRKEKVDSSNMQTEPAVLEETKKQMQREYDELLKRTAAKLEEQLKEATIKLNQQLEAEREAAEAARRAQEAAARGAQEAAARRAQEAAAKEPRQAEAAWPGQVIAAATEAVVNAIFTPSSGNKPRRQVAENKPNSGRRCVIQ